MRLVLYQPDIPQNTGTILRMAACLDIGVDIIGPTGFDMSNRALRRSGLDYIEKIELIRHLSWEDYISHPHDSAISRQADPREQSEPGPRAQPDMISKTGSDTGLLPEQISTDRSRLVLLTTRATQPYLDFSFRPNDRLMLGRESAGVPPHVHNNVDARITIPLHPGFRSLNIALAGAMVLGEALRQTDGFAHIDGITHNPDGTTHNPDAITHNNE